MKNYRIAVLGSTGVVGREMIRGNSNCFPHVLHFQYGITSHLQPFAKQKSPEIEKIWVIFFFHIINNMSMRNTTLIFGFNRGK